MNLKQIFKVQRNFDRRRGWNRYEKCRTPEEILDFMQHFIVVTVEELEKSAESERNTKETGKHST